MHNPPGGSNQYFIDSDFGTFEADGNAMLMRRVAEINAIAKLNAISKTDEFTKAAAQAAVVPLDTAKDLISQPVTTIASVPRGIWGFLNRAGQTVKEVADGASGGPNQGGLVSNVSGFSKTKRDLAIKLGVDPYTDNDVFQKDLSKVAWPAFMGKFVVSTGLGAISGGVGTALSAVNWSVALSNALVDKSPADLRLMNLGLLMNNMGVAREDADAFLYNGAISPTTQTLLVAALNKLGNIPGQADFIRAAATSQDEHDALGFMQSVQIAYGQAERTNPRCPGSRTCARPSRFARLSDVVRWRFQFSGISWRGLPWSINLRSLSRRSNLRRRRRVIRSS